VRRFCRAAPRQKQRHRERMDRRIGKIGHMLAVLPRRFTGLSSIATIPARSPPLSVVLSRAAGNPSLTIIRYYCNLSRPLINPSANVQPADTYPVAMTPALKESIVTYSDGEKTFEG
jgi:hypothetical protein